MGIYWTIQTIEKWNEVKNSSYLLGVHDHIWPDFIEPYHWMMKQMDEKIPNYKGEYPIWVWTDRPDLRESGHLNKGDRGVLLKIEIEDHRVLLSDFQAWHFVLNKWYFDLEDFENDNSHFSQYEMEKSWEMIFNIDFLTQHPNWGTCTLQSVTGKVMLKEITLEKEFIAR